MPPHMTLLSRDASSDSSAMSDVSIGGFCVAGVVGVGLAIWLAIVLYRKHAKAKTTAASGALSTNTGNRVSTADVHIDVEKASVNSDSEANPRPVKAGGFSRTNLTASVILPAKTLSREEVLAHHTAEGTLPRPFRPILPAFGPFSNISITTADPDTSSRDSLTDSMLRPSSRFLSPTRDSFSFSKRSSARSSIMSTLSSIRASTEAYKQRKVRQLFTPILPDELVLKLGETVSVAQTFDDGWCIVGRDSMFKPGEVELGAVPSWAFIKPTKGLKCDRPIRSTSLGVTVQLDADGPAFREDIISWSNF